MMDLWMEIYGHFMKCASHILFTFKLLKDLWQGLRKGVSSPAPAKRFTSQFQPAEVLKDPPLPLPVSVRSK